MNNGIWDFIRAEFVTSAVRAEQYLLQGAILFFVVGSEILTNYELKIADKEETKHE